MLFTTPAIDVCSRTLWLALSFIANSTLLLYAFLTHPTHTSHAAACFCIACLHGASRSLVTPSARNLLAQVAPASSPHFCPPFPNPTDARHTAIYAPHTSNFASSDP
ncbi:hypothetical protein ABPG77_000188 [Micractinium sp. CCAP 211/92]